MGTGVGGGSYNSSIEGLKWYASPGSGVLTSQTNQHFNVTVIATPTLVTLENCKFELINATDLSVLSSTTGGIVNSSYCYLSITYTTTVNNNIFGRLSVDTDKTTGFVIVDADWKWILMEDNVKSWRTMTSFFEELKDLSEFGEGNIAEYNRIVFFFLIVTIILSVFIFFSGVELTSPGGNLIIIWGIVAMASFGGFLTIDSGVDAITPFFEQFGYFIILTTLLLGFVLNLLRKTMD